jgi:uncharacterized protein YfiM (DUF2279 family)
MNRLLFFAVLVLLLAGHAWTQIDTSSPPDSLKINLKHTAHDQWVAPDKAHHFMASAFITGFTYYACKQELDFSEQQASTVCVSLSLSVGLAKEVYDGVSGKGTPSFKDIIADAAGVAFGIFIISVSSQ